MSAAPFTVRARLVYSHACEEGHVYRLVAHEPAGALRGEAPILLVPPFGADGREDPLGLGYPREPRPILLRLRDTGVAPDAVPLVDPRPGTGLGRFLPPGTLSARGTFVEVLGVELPASS